MWTLEKSRYSLLFIFLTLFSLSRSEFLVDLTEGKDEEEAKTTVEAVDPLVTMKAHFCDHGEWTKNDDGEEICRCEDKYVGEHCHLFMHCTSFDRYENNTCIECEQGWEGSFCEKIICDKGKPNPNGDICICDKPHSGNFCETQTTEAVYLYYNSLMYSWGPIGVLSIIPLYIILYGCRYMAKKRQVKRVERALEEQRQDDVDSDIVDMLLHKKYTK
ncbi:hypothetical protein QR680_014161 [Steinernema hermaphroditum]|uniref:EGF-like domain-containing protein n=1 Tax=Steinernema hermaphroditum TaxID=289476 RepID=A0AA39M3Q6_9BILA|nr:hypothetical protein QR680_014161 [Steinernema hermaphroditum]